MDKQTMECFLALTREGNISAAASALHISQPALSRKLMDLEEQLGARLFERGSRRVTLTEEGLILKKRAEEIMRLMSQTEREIASAGSGIRGEINIGAGESSAFHFLSRAAGELYREHPLLRFHVTSGDTADLIDQLNSGLLDLALVFSDFDKELYQSIRLPLPDHFGLLMRKGSRLAALERVSVKDIGDRPVLISRAEAAAIQGDDRFRGLNVIGTYNLINNAALMVEDICCFALCFEGLVDTGAESPLCIRPFDPPLNAYGSVIWKKYQPLSAAAQLFINKLRSTAELG